MQVTLEIPDDVVRQLPSAPAEREARLLLELSVALYAKGLLSLSEGAKMSSLSRNDFGWEVGERGIARHYEAVDLAEDIAYASRQ